MKVEIWILFIVFLILVFSFCTRNYENYESIGKVERSFVLTVVGDSTAFDSKKQSPDSIRNVNVIVDITESMRGFCNSGRTLGEFISTLESSLYPSPVRYYSFSNTLEQLNRDLFLECEFYSAEKADYSLIRDTEKSPIWRNAEITFFITDLQLNRTIDAKHFADIITDYISNPRKFVAFLGSSLNFHGYYFPNDIRSERVYTGKRPVYAVLFGEKKYYSDFSTIVSRSRIWVNKLVLFPLQKMKVYVDYREKHCEYSKLKFDYVDPATRSLLIIRTTSDGLDVCCFLENSFFKDWKIFRPNDFVLKIYELDPKTLEVVDSFNADSFNARECSEERVKRTLTVNDTTPDDTLKLKLSIRGLRHGKHYLLFLKIQPNISGIDDFYYPLPQWINEWTTTQAEPPETQAYKTLDLNRIISSVLMRINNPYVFGYSLIYIIQEG